MPRIVRSIAASSLGLSYVAITSPWPSMLAAATPPTLKVLTSMNHLCPSSRRFLPYLLALTSLSDLTPPSIFARALSTSALTMHYRSFDITGKGSNNVDNQSYLQNDAGDLSADEERIFGKTDELSSVSFVVTREFINSMMGIVSALLKDLLHCDPSEANVWFSVNPLDPHDVVPDWPKDNEGTLDMGKYPKRSGVLGEAMEGKVCRQPCHDLEALFWVIWTVGVNSASPYLQCHEWLPAKPSPLPGGSHFRQLSTPIVNSTNPTFRTPRDAMDKGIPYWTAPGLHEDNAEAILKFKREILEMQFVESTSPYGRAEGAGDAFEKGMLKLRDRFEFTEILKEMRGGIPADKDCDGAANEIVKAARQRFEELMNSGKDLGVPISLASAKKFQVSLHLSHNFEYWDENYQRQEIVGAISSWPGIR
ncbi:hypothetical protein JVU11DRAFT_12676 [Chiua virens]|nr:hypothetical protein JVU11DRAFT_12676 [Chiua virens]